MKVINVFGAPGAGKSTIASGLFYSLKLMNKNCELVSEYAKDLVWEDRQITLENQIYIFSKQFHKLERLKNKVDLVVTDSPILLSMMYADLCKTKWPNSFKQLILDIYNNHGFENINVLLKRNHNYENVGRYQTEQQSNELHNKILYLLDDNNQKYHIFSTDDKQILNKIIKLV